MAPKINGAWSQRDSGRPTSAQSKVVLPRHHDDLYPVFLDLATEPLKMRVHEQLPETSTIQPVYVEPVTVGLKTGIISEGDGSRHPMKVAGEENC